MMAAGVNKFMYHFKFGIAYDIATYIGTVCVSFLMWTGPKGPKTSSFISGGHIERS
jgi:hypothetical protein